MGTTERAGRREWIALGVLALPLLLVSMDVSVLYFAVPFISADLGVSATEQLWIFDIYGFVLAGLLITMGSLGDRIGRRRLLIFGAAGFGLASVAAAYAQSPEQLIAARAMLGIGGATLMPSTLALIRNMFHDPAQRSKAIAFWSAVMMGGITLGPVLGGFLLEHFWWGSVFLINTPAMVLLLILAPMLLPEFKTPTRGAVRPDRVGAVADRRTAGDLGDQGARGQWCVRVAGGRDRGRGGLRGAVRPAAADRGVPDARSVDVPQPRVQRVARGQHGRHAGAGR